MASKIFWSDTIQINVDQEMEYVPDFSETPATRVVVTVLSILVIVGWGSCHHLAASVEATSLRTQD